MFNTVIYLLTFWGLGLVGRADFFEQDQCQKASDHFVAQGYMTSGCVPVGTPAASWQYRILDKDLMPYGGRLLSLNKETIQ